MFSFFKSSNVVQQATKSWRLLFNQTFCCHARPDHLFFSKQSSSYATFNSDDDADEILSSYGDHDDEIIVKKLERPSSLDGLLTPTLPGSQKSTNVVTNQPCPPLPYSTSASSNATTPLLSPQNTLLCIPKTSFSTDTFTMNSSVVGDNSSSGVSSGGLTQPSSMEFSDTLDNELTSDEKQNNSNVVKDDSYQNQPLFSSSNEEDTSQPDLLSEFSPTAKPDEEIKELGTTTSDELLQIVEACQNPLEVLNAVQAHQVPIIPLLGVACIHYIYLKALNNHERNSPSYNKLCGIILTNPHFRNMLATIEQNASTLNNFALLTVASDLLYLRITLKKSTITTLLSHVDYELLTLVELRLLASCLHTPSIPMLNSDYVHNVAGSLAMRYLNEITDLYTLLSILKSFGRYFTTAAKREADALVSKFIDHLKLTYPDGRLMASHMFDAFYRMEYAPSRPLQLEACRAINSSTIPLLPQDVSAILRYFVKYGYNLNEDGYALLDKISIVLYRHLDTEPASKFTTNIKWLSVFYYYNEPLLARYIAIVRRDMKKLDFVALSDVLDTMAQVYYLPEGAEEFFEELHKEMMEKLPTLHRSNVKNVQRKLLFTAFHFSVFGRYPQSLINVTLTPEQIQLNNGLNKHYMREFCESVRIERPDLLPPTLPQYGDANFTNPKLYAFEKDVRSVLTSVVGQRKFTHASSPVRGLPMFVLRQQLDGSILSVKRNPPGFIPPHFRQTVHNVAVVPLPRSRFCINSKHAVGKTRHALRLIRAQGARVVTIPHFDWDGHSFEHKAALLSRKIFNQRTDDVIE